VYSLRVGADRAGPISDLELPAEARAMCVYRDGEEFAFAGSETRLEEGDEVVVLTRARALHALRERFG
jgi:trk system potassium uptake protein TrkA